jgi:hypothetical protein
MTPSPEAARWRQPLRLHDLTLYRLARLSAVAGSMVVKLCEGRFGITRREWRLIAALADAGPQASLALLIDKRLVRRDASAPGGRGAQLRLTDAGLALHAALWPEVAQINTALLEALGDQEVAQFEAAIVRLTARAQEMAAHAQLPKTGRGGRARHTG